MSLRFRPEALCLYPYREYPENGQTVGNTLAEEVMAMLAVWLMLSSLLYSLQLQTGSFPKPLTEAEERYYLELAAQGDLAARNVLIERNLRLVAHIMNKS
jgi:RNA polymerase sporulation-specific sigma factor